MVALALNPNASSLFPQINFGQLAEHRPALLRFAKRKVRDEALAEDAVQDTLVAALLGLDKFQGQSALKTWLIGILNHKIQDIFRRESRYIPFSTDEDGNDSSGQDLIADERTLDPEADVARTRMLRALSMEVDGLPTSLKEVFQMQALDDLPTEEVCEALNITEANCWVRLHRARKHLSTRMASHF